MWFWCSRKFHCQNTQDLEKSTFKIRLNNTITANPSHTESSIAVSCFPCDKFNIRVEILSQTGLVCSKSLEPILVTVTLTFLQHYTVLLHLCSRLYAVFMRKGYPSSRISNDTPDFYSHTHRRPHTKTETLRSRCSHRLLAISALRYEIFFLEWKNRSDT